MQIMDNISTVKVSLNEVMEKLKLMSSYLGAKRETNANGYDKVAVLDSDSRLVGMLMEDVSLLLAARLPKSLLRWRYYRSALEFTFEGDMDSESLQPALANAVTQEVIRRWLCISGSEYADTVSAPATDSADALKIYFPKKKGVKASPRRISPL